MSAIDARECPTQRYVFPQGLDKGIVTAGEFKNDLYVLNANGTVDKLAPGSYTRKFCFDLRDAMIQHQSVHAVRPKDPHSFFLPIYKPEVGGRADARAGPHAGMNGTIHSAVDGHVLVESPFKPLSTGEKVDIRKGIVGCAAQMVSSKDRLFVVVGREDYLLLYAWDGSTVKHMVIKDNGDDPRVESLDCVFDEGAEKLHVVWGGAEVKHVVVDTALWVQSAARIVCEDPRVVWPGALLLHTPGSPHAVPGDPRYSMGGMDVPFTLTADADVSMDANTGNGWVEVVRAELKAGEHSFKHELGNAYAGAVQYRLHTRGRSKGSQPA